MVSLFYLWPVGGVSTGLLVRVGVKDTGKRVELKNLLSLRSVDQTLRDFLL